MGVKRILPAGFIKEAVLYPKELCLPKADSGSFPYAVSVVRYALYPERIDLPIPFKEGSYTFGHHKKNVFFILSVIVFIFPFLFLVSSSYAFVRIDNMKVKLNVSPGQTKSGQIRVENPYSESVKVKVYLEDWVYVPPGDGAKEFMPSGTTALSCAPWITFAPAEFTMPPFSSRVVSFAVNVPEEIKEGRYAIMFFETVPQAKGEGISVMIATRIGTLFFIEPQGLINRSAELSNLILRKVDEDSSLEISLDFKNRGNVAQVVEKGIYSVIDKTGKVYARGQFNNIYTFPNDTVRLSGKIKSRLPQGIYDLVITLNRDNEVIVREAEIEIDSLGQTLRIGGLK